jgi:hypothetical protein
MRSTVPQFVRYVFGVTAYCILHSVWEGCHQVLYCCFHHVVTCHTCVLSVPTRMWATERGIFHINLRSRLECVILTRHSNPLSTAGVSPWKRNQGSMGVLASCEVCWCCILRRASFRISYWLGVSSVLTGPHVPEIRHLCAMNHVKYLGLHLDRRLTWLTHIFAKRKQLGLSLTKIY